MKIPDSITSTWSKILLCILLLPVFAWAQDKNLFFRHLTTNEGLSHNSVYSICEDDNGFIWIGTRSGLNRFDGYTFKIYDNQSGLRNAYINTIFKDSKGRIWIGTMEGGLSLYNSATDSFKTFIFDSPNPGITEVDNIQAIAEDSKGNIWAGTHKDDLFRVEEKEGKLIRFHLPDRLKAGAQIERINCMLFETDSLLWLGTMGGLFRYNQITDKVSPAFSEDGIINVHVLCLFNENEQKSGLAQVQEC